MGNQELKQKIDNLGSDTKYNSERLIDLDDLVSNKLLPTCMAFAVIYTEASEERKAEIKARNPEFFNKFIGMIEKGRVILKSKQKYCVDCNLLLDKNDKFCKECGKEL